MLNSLDFALDERPFQSFQNFAINPCANQKFRVDIIFKSFLILHDLKKPQNIVEIFPRFVQNENILASEFYLDSILKAVLSLAFTHFGHIAGSSLFLSCFTKTKKT